MLNVKLMIITYVKQKDEEGNILALASDIMCCWHIVVNYHTT